MNIKNIHYLIALFFIFITSHSYGQSSCTKLEIINNPRNINYECIENTCESITASINDIKSSIDGANAYTLESINYNEAQSYQIPSQNKIFVNQDDVFSSNIILPFKFCYYGNTYNSIVIGANGIVSFDIQNANLRNEYMLCDRNNNTYTIPSTNNVNLPKNSIFALFQDLDPTATNANTSNKAIGWNVEGTFPCRKFIINWIDVPLFGCPFETATFQLVLHETTNIIDVFIQKKPICTIWNCGLATIGLQNSTGQYGISPTNRNASAFTITNTSSEAWRFKPNGPSIFNNLQFSLYKENTLLSTINGTRNNNKIEANFNNLCINNGENAKFYVKTTFQNCSNELVSLSDSINISITNRTIAPPVVQTRLNFCINEIPSRFNVIGQNLKWYYTLTGPADSLASIPNTSIPGSRTIYVTQTIDGCQSERIPITYVVNNKSYHTINQKICKTQSYTYRNQVYTTPVTRYDTFTNINGCDSIVTFNLIVDSFVNKPVNVTICSGNTYNHYGRTYNQTIRNQKDTIKNNNGCDTIVTLNLTVNPPITRRVNIEICKNETYLYNNIPLNNDTTFIDSFKTLTGCDSLILFNLKVNRYKTAQTNAATICSGKTYTWRNKIYNMSGTYYDTVFSNTSCDSVYILRLSISPPKAFTLRDTICAGDSLEYRGKWYKSQTSVVDTFSTLDGCDSLVYFHLNIRNYKTSSQTITLCQGASITINGNTYYTNTNNINDTINNPVGCDSIIIYNLRFTNALTSTQNISICPNELPYNWRNKTIYNIGNDVAKDTILTSQGCDSIVTLNLAFKPTNNINIIINKCESELPFTWNNQTINTVGTHYLSHTTINQYGCDSITNATINIRNILTATVDTTVCESALPFNWNNLVIANSGPNVGRYTSRSNITGCDSITTLNVNIINTIYYHDNVTICSSSLPYYWNNISISTTGNNVASYTSRSNITGCDSITILNLNISPLITATIYDTICSSSLPYVWNGQTLYSSGTITFSNKSFVSKCDSITTLHLNVINPDTQIISQVVCKEELPITWNNILVSRSGNNVAQYTTYSLLTGCDSVSILNLEVIEPIYKQDTIVTCINDLPYFWNNKNYNIGGINIDTFRSTSINTGCDSFSVLHIITKDTLSAIVNVSICPDELPYRWNGKIITTPGNNIAIDTSLSSIGCDSFTMLNLTLKRSDSININFSICQTDLPYNWNNQIINNVGLHTLRYITINSEGCDSLTIANIVVDTIIRTNIDSTICESALPIVWNNITINNGGQNVASYTTKSSLNSCDSITTLNLNLIRNIIVNNYDTICSSSIPYTWNGQNITTSGIYNYNTISSVTNCDSTTILNLIIIQPDTQIQNITICETELPLIWNGINVSQGGMGVALFRSNSLITNCDSITLLTLNIKNTIYKNDTVKVCANAFPLLWNNKYYSNSGMNLDSFTTLSTITNCDSTTILNIIVLDTTTAIEHISICENELPYIWNGINIYNPGLNVAQYKTKGINNCDSITILNLSLLPIHITQVDTFICYENTPFNWYNQRINNAGTYMHILKNSSQCDSTIYLNVTISPEPKYIENINLTGCDSISHNGRTYYTSQFANDTIKSVKGCDSLYYNVNIRINKSIHDTINVNICEGEYYNFDGINYSQSIITTSYDKTIHNCDSNTTLILRVNPKPKLELEILKYDKFCIGDTIIIKGHNANNYQWFVDNTEMKMANNDILQFVSTQTNHNIKLIGLTEAGCIDSTQFDIYSENCCEFGIPNAFSPNNDGLNDYFKIVTPGNPKSFEMQIFDRWGKRVFYSIKATDTWNGQIDGKIADNGVYYYLLKIVCTDDSEVTKKGDITLIR